MICLSVLIEHWLVTDTHTHTHTHTHGQADRQIDRHRAWHMIYSFINNNWQTAIYRASIVSRGKNVKFICKSRFTGQTRVKRTSIEFYKWGSLPKSVNTPLVWSIVIPSIRFDLPADTGNAWRAPSRWSRAPSAPLPHNFRRLYVTESIPSQSALIRLTAACLLSVCLSVCLFVPITFPAFLGAHEYE